ncbi:MAG TPA: LysR family transcriptional regulator, partial [Firmicutes bacterium]|nr:LysR family transcriptional regulator [Bacillota bacterium]
MNFERLEIFQTVAELKSFTEAGYILNLSQSSISKHIKALEEYYDTQLFERKGNRVEL